ncbi:hypothetical protein A0H76_1028 [Hepatospora eriocheir]|uniref:Uncharacterized protein n=1 Tax=Hepatospora eriocheir TaxID=1081669 RepID=A0A1X0QL26_9MICR|nr:hypothetical protein A0H76_1028 [Hepatospora eriocheir]
MFGFISGYEINAFKNLFNLEYKEESFKKNIYCRTMKYFNCEENSIVDLNNLSSFRFGTVYFDQKINISFFIICRKSDLENVIYDFKYLIKNGLNYYYIYKNNINAKCNSSFVSTILKELESKYSEFKIFFEVYKIKDYFHTKSLNTLISRLNQIIDLNILNDFAIDFCFSIFGRSNEETFMIKNNIYKTKFINKYFCNADFKYCNYKKNFYFFDVKYNLISLVCGLFKVDFYNSFVNNYISPKERNVIVLYLSLSLISKFFNFNINDENNTIREYLNDYIKVLDDLNYSDIGKISLRIEFSINVKTFLMSLLCLYSCL